MSFDVCKICDFSWAAKCEQRRQTNCGTLDYLSPEMISGEGYSSSIDLWAMGVLLYEMLVGKPPFYNTSIKETTKRIKECSFTLPESLSKCAK
jgi:serine/threonine protein kinase